jgi:carotenoid cleavage dioxygenase-like enzyme
MEWKPEEGSIIYVFNRNDMSLACKPITIDPFWVFHYTNGFENKDGNIEFELIKYKDYATVDNFLK